MTNLKHKKILQKMMENGGISVSQAMRDVGYSKAYAKNPQKVMKTRSFQALVEKAFPVNIILRLHKELLEKKTIQHIDFPDSLNDSRIKSILKKCNSYELCEIVQIKSQNIKRAYYLERDTKTAIWAIHTYHKLKGNYFQQKIEKTSPLADTSLEELRAMTEEINKIETRYLQYRASVKSRKIN
ncbi:hypothetical protein IPM65_02210 [Candidatus Roizmanbacteria bacterium]|nr:MAG: hypothetical protein IPM65_02210 [Candidatus Roizmanbacteria bacterium]